MYSPFSRVGVPTSNYMPTAEPLGATGFHTAGSVYNLQRRVPFPGGGNFDVNILSRVPAGWATNPLRGRTAVLTGNGFSGGQI